MNEELADELEALGAIYEAVVFRDDSARHCVQFPLPDSGVTIQVTFPDDYPEKSVPVGRVLPLPEAERSPSSNQLGQAERALKSLWEDGGPRAIVFEWAMEVEQLLRSEMGVGEGADEGQAEDESGEQEGGEDDEEDLEAVMAAALDFSRYDAKNAAQKAQRKAQGKSGSGKGGVETEGDHGEGEGGGIEIVAGEPITDRKSKFVAHGAAVRSLEEVEAVKDALLQDRRIARATHNMVAYRFHDASGDLYEGRDDDGETGAGDRMLSLLRLLGTDGAVVVVTRWYGGIQLGHDRFTHINGRARELLEANGWTAKTSGKDAQ